MDSGFEKGWRRERVLIRVRRIAESESPALPARETAASAGYDVRAANPAPIVLKPGARVAVPTGLCLAVPEGYEVQVRPRSGLALKHGIIIPNSPGTIDPDYRGELQVILMNLGDEPFLIRPGDRIAQLVVARVAEVEWEEVSELPATGRGAGGFGHTGL